MTQSTVDDDADAGTNDIGSTNENDNSIGVGDERSIINDEPIVEEIDADKQIQATTNCFTSIQQRRFWLPISDVSIGLCPSMDLISFGSMAAQRQPPDASTTIHLHRTVNWQKLASVVSNATPTTTASGGDGAACSNDNTTAASEVVISSSAAALHTHVVWRPDGRFLALADTHGRVSLFSVEDMLNQNNRSDGLFDGTTDEGDETDVPGKVHTITIPTLSARNDNHDTMQTSHNKTTTTMVTGMTWAHIGQPHPIWSKYEQEEEPYAKDSILFDHDADNFYGDDNANNKEVDIMWKYRSLFVDREQDFLPPSEYHKKLNIFSTENNNNNNNNNSPLPNSQTPLSVLYVTTTTATLPLLVTKKDNETTETTTNDNDSGMDSLNCGMESYLHMYLHGRYPIALHLDLDNDDDIHTKTSIVASADMAHVLIVGRERYSCHDDNNIQPKNNSSTILTMYSIPALSSNRYTFQQISTLYSKISTHLHYIQSNISSVAASYRSSLKPIDLKLDALHKLLHSYGLLGQEHDQDNNDDVDEGGGKPPLSSNNNTNNNADKMRPLLVQYILSGHTRTSPNLSNAIDQFFTSAQMNDQLLIRMERSLSAAVSNVEKALKQTLLAPAIALHYSVDALHGLARYRPDVLSSSSSVPRSNAVPSSVRQLVIATELLVVSIETTLMELIEARFRLRDFVAWLRSTGAQIKARGTAPKSVQRENAKKRRVPDSVARRMLSYLRQEGTYDQLPNIGTNDDTEHSTEEEVSRIAGPVGNYCGTTETILALRISSLLRKVPTFVVIGSREQPENNENKNPAVLDGRSNGKQIRTTPTIPCVLEKTIQAAERVFDHPRSFLSKSIRRCKLRIRNKNDANDIVSINDESNRLFTPSKNLIAVITRLGQGGINTVAYYDEPKPEGFFVPRAIPPPPEIDIDNQMPVAESFRQWSVIAQVSEANENEFRLDAIPLKWINVNDNDDFDSDDDDDDSVDPEDQHCLASRFHWTCQLSFPSDCTIQEIAFYGDDGKSSLLSSSGVDNTTGTGQEGRQALGVLVSRRQTHDDTEIPSAPTKLELWLVDYDSLPYTCLPITHENAGSDDVGDPVLSLCMESDTLHQHSKPVEVVALSESVDECNPTETNSDRVIVTAKTRELSVTMSDEGRCRVVLSGSRGIGSIFVTERHGGTSMELLDLEENEDGNEEDEGEEEEEAIDEQGGSPAEDDIDKMDTENE